jgi:hypothetical protein
MDEAMALAEGMFGNSKAGLFLDFRAQGDAVTSVPGAVAKSLTLRAWRWIRRGWRRRKRCRCDGY